MRSVCRLTCMWEHEWWKCVQWTKTFIYIPHKQHNKMLRTNPIVLNIGSDCMLVLSQCASTLNALIPRQIFMIVSNMTLTVLCELHWVNKPEATDFYHGGKCRNWDTHTRKHIDVCWWWTLKIPNELPFSAYLKLKLTCPFVVSLNFSSHITRTASWLPPAECWTHNIEYPYGWEKAIDGKGRPYYVK